MSIFGTGPLALICLRARALGTLSFFSQNLCTVSPDMAMVRTASLALASSPNRTPCPSTYM